MSATPVNASPQALPLREQVAQAMRLYFQNLEDGSVTNLYELVLSEVEAPLLQSVMQKVCGNQSRAAEILGINRGTLRKKLLQYNLA